MDYKLRNNADDKYIFNLEPKIIKTPNLYVKMNSLQTKHAEQNNFEFGSTSSRASMNNSISPWVDRSSKKVAITPANKKIKPRNINTALKIIPNLQFNDHMNSLGNSQALSTKSNYSGAYPLFEYPKNQLFNFQNSIFTNKIKKKAKIKQATLIKARLDPDFSKTDQSNGNSFGFAFYPTHNPKKHRMSILFANSLMHNSPKLGSPKPQTNDKSIPNFKFRNLSHEKLNSENQILYEKDSKRRLKQERGSSQQSFKTHETVPEDFRSLFYQKRTTTAPPTNLKYFNSFTNSSMSHNRKNFMGISLINQEPIRDWNKNTCSSGKLVEILDNSDLNHGSYLTKNYRNMSLIHKKYYANVLKKTIKRDSPGSEKRKPELENDGTNRNNNVNLETIESIKYNDMKFHPNKKMYRDLIKSSSFRDNDFKIDVKKTSVDLLDYRIRESRSKAENIKQNLSRSKNNENSNDFGPW